MCQYGFWSQNTPIRKTSDNPDSIFFHGVFLINNAFACGEAAVKAAVEGKSGYMVKIVRETEDGRIKWSTGLQPLSEVANVEHFVPREWVSPDGYLPNEQFVEYAAPLVEGESKPPIEGGLPKYVAIECSKVEKKLPPRV